MADWVKEWLISVGGGVTVIIALLTVLKSIVSRIVEKSIDTSFEKSTIKLSNKLERTTKAYEILLKKEFDYYEKIDPYMAALVPLVQDLVYWASDLQKADSDNAREKYREHLSEYLKMIPEIKNDSVLFQPYIPADVFEAVAVLLKNMQSDLQYLAFVGEVLYEKTDGEIDTNKLNEISDKVLMSVALIETRVKNRLMELSNN